MNAGALAFSSLFTPGPQSTGPPQFCIFPLESSRSENALMGLLGDSICSQVDKFNYDIYIVQEIKMDHTLKLKPLKYKKKPWQ